MILAKLQRESRKYHKITIYCVSGRKQTQHAGPSSPNNRASQEPKRLASLNAPGAFLSWPPVFPCQGEKSLRLTLLAPRFYPDGPLQFDQVRLCLFWSPSRCAAWKQLGAND